MTNFGGLPVELQQYIIEIFMVDEDEVDGYERSPEKMRILNLRYVNRLFCSEIDAHHWKNQQTCRLSDLLVSRFVLQEYDRLHVEDDLIDTVRNVTKILRHEIDQHSTLQLPYVSPSQLPYLVCMTIVRHLGQRAMFDVLGRRDIFNQKVNCIGMFHGRDDMVAAVSVATMHNLIPVVTALGAKCSVSLSHLPGDIYFGKPLSLAVKYATPAMVQLLLRPPFNANPCRDIDYSDYARAASASSCSCIIVECEPDIIGYCALFGKTDMLIVLLQHFPSDSSKHDRDAALEALRIASSYGNIPTAIAMLHTYKFPDVSSTRLMQVVLQAGMHAKIIETVLAIRTLDLAERRACMLQLVNLAFFQNLVPCMPAATVSLLDLSPDTDTTSISIPNGNFEEILHRAIRYKLTSVAQLLIDKGVTLNSTEFSKNGIVAAVMTKDWKILRFVLANEVDWDVLLQNSRENWRVGVKVEDFARLMLQGQAESELLKMLEEDIKNRPDMEMCNAGEDMSRKKK